MASLFPSHTNAVRPYNFYRFGCNNKANDRREEQHKSNGKHAFILDARMKIQTFISLQAFSVVAFNCSYRARRSAPVPRRDMISS